ncbi:Tic20 family protein [Geminocystis herdmanii]|uniref:Tic20 family protein n=1 Tax=Geminocystis herdmanii TaxID=669359 RepID=UPI00034737C3|nr:Tic20 family protein [Geminocystis herdmanii]
MSWRNTTDGKDKIFGALVYLFPLYSALQFGAYLFAQIPFLKLLAIPLTPLIIINQIPFGGFILFIILYSAVVRNSRISHFIRFNTMQSILMEILLILISLVVNVFAGGLGGGLLIETIFNTIFLGTLIGCIYGMVQSVSGKYPDIPLISEAASGQVPW